MTCLNVNIHVHITAFYPMKMSCLAIVRKPNFGRFIKFGGRFPLAVHRTVVSGKTFACGAIFCSGLRPAPALPAIPSRAQQCTRHSAHSKRLYSLVMRPHCVSTIKSPSNSGTVLCLRICPAHNVGPILRFYEWNVMPG